MSNHDPYSDSPEPAGWIQHNQLYSGLGADIVMESITLIEFGGGFGADRLSWNQAEAPRRGSFLARLLSISWQNSTLPPVAMYLS